MMNGKIIGLPCLFHLWTGLNCPGCGMTRFVFALARGNVAEAVQYNYFGILILAWIVWLVIELLLRRKRDSKKFSKAFRYASLIFLILLILWGIARNIFGI